MANMIKPKAVIFDIDEVLISSKKLEKEAEKANIDIYEYFKNHILDMSYSEYNKPMIDIFESYCKHFDYHVFVLTARSEEIRKETSKQLSMISHWCFNGLFMRKTNDSRPAWQVKRDYLKQIQQDYDVVLAVDDDDSIIRMYRNNNVKNVVKVYLNELS